MKNTLNIVKVKQFKQHKFLSTSIFIIIFLACLWLFCYRYFPQLIGKPMLSSTEKNIRPSSDANQQCSVNSNCKGGCYMDIAGQGVNIEDVNINEIKRLNIIGKCADLLYEYKHPQLLNNPIKGFHSQASLHWCQTKDISENVIIFDSSQKTCPAPPPLRN